MTQSDGERAFETLLRTAGADIPKPERNFRFDANRRWTFDFAWPIRSVRVRGNKEYIVPGVAVEIDGGNMMVRWSDKLRRHVAVGRHTKRRDYEKLNAATLAGWVGFRFTPDMIADDPDGCLNLVRQALGLPVGNR